MSKSDRELLALAARAAGLLLCGYSWIGENEDDEECEILEAAFVKHHQEQELASNWNPLTDDGDALRLAVKLGLLINVNGMFVHADCCNRDDDIGYFEENSARNDGCILKAARRAIVRAAAAIGEAM